MEGFILDFVSFIGHLDFSMVFKIFLILYGIFWFFIVIWVWFDACDKSDKWIFRIFSALIVLLFNILGLIIYFLIRPAQSYEERYWQELEKKYLEFETGGLVNCSSCGFGLEPSFANCPNCGKSVKVKCEGCEMYVEPNWKYCAYCGWVRNDAEFIEPDLDENLDKMIELEKDEDVEAKNMEEEQKREEARRRAEERKARREVLIKDWKSRASIFFTKVGKNSNELIVKLKRFLKDGESEDVEEFDDDETEFVSKEIKEESGKKNGEKKKKKKKKKSNRKSQKK